jgi:hypothetical protein
MTLFRRLLLMSVLLCALLAPASADAAIDYPDFSNVAGLQLNGDAKQEGTVLNLTPALSNKRGTVFSTSPLNPAESFENQFAISMHDSTCCVVGTLKPADGMAFVIQGAGLNPGEGLGGSLGYSGIKPSVIVEFDIFYNVGEPLTDHIAIMTEGDGAKHLQCANAGPTPTCTANLTFPLYGAPVYGWVEYDAPSQHLKVWASQSSTKPASPLLDYGVSLAPLGSSVYAGFSAATGAHNAVQDVLSWRQGTLGSLSPTAGPAPGPTEEPKAKKGCGKKKAKGKGKGKGKHKGASSSKKKKKKPKCKRKKGKGKGKGHGK